MTLIALRASLSCAATTDCPQRLGPGAAISGTRGERVRPIFSELARRPDVERTSDHDDPVIQQALTVLGQALNPIRVVDLKEIREIYARNRAGAPPLGLDAFRAPGDTSDSNIYVNRDSIVYRSAARKPSALSMLKLAATLAHEQVHNTDRDFAAYRLQSDFVRSRLNNISRRQQEGARQYLQGLDARANALARDEQLRHEWATRLGCQPRSNRTTHQGENTAFIVKRNPSRQPSHGRYEASDWALPVNPR